MREGTIGGWRKGRREEGGGSDEQGDGGGGRVQGEGGREGERGRDRVRGGRKEAMMLDRQRASVDEGRVEGGRVDEGNERGRDGTRRGRNREEASGGGIERGREGARKGNIKGCITRRELASIQYIHKPSHNAALAIGTLLLQ